MRETEPRQSTPSPPPLPIDDELLGALVPRFETPQTVRSLQRTAAKIRTRVQKGQLIKGLLSSFVKGALIQAHAGAQAQSSLRETRAAENARIARLRTSRRSYIQKGGALKVSEARNMVRHNQEEVARKARVAAYRAERLAERVKRDELKALRYER